MPNPLIIDEVLVLGAGTMGMGIAQWFLQQGRKVHLYEKDEGQLQKAQSQFRGNWEQLKAKGKIKEEDEKSFGERLFFLPTLAGFYQHARKCDLVCEAVIEEMEVKKALFKETADMLGDSSAPNPHCLYSSNTSGLSLTQMAKALPEEKRPYFLGIHFFNPAPLMPLVEIIRTPWNSPVILQGICDWFSDMKKRPVLCQDRPGFIVNRINRNFYGEALRIPAHHPLTEESLREVDETLKQVGGFKMGPFELMDMIGIDVNLAVTEHLWQSFAYHPRFAPHFQQQQKVLSGHLGRKTGQGFYRHERNQ